MKTLIELSTKIFDEKELLHKIGELGKTIEANGCEYNFNRDVDKLCFKNALARFLRTGTKEDAFDVFFCYSEIFKTFGGYKNGNDTLLELLYQHEANSATLLTKHRDHYSHSVYVFALGLAIFMNNKTIRDAFTIRYGEENFYEKFLKYWGMAGLFHDSGFADGADLLFAEEALKCGIDVIAVLPCSWKSFMKEHNDGGVKFMQILGQTKEVKVKPNQLRRYEDMSRYIVKQCDEMLVLWDGVVLPLEDENGQELNRGGTYDTLQASQSASKKVVQF